MTIHAITVYHGLTHLPSMLWVVTFLQLCPIWGRCVQIIKNLQCTIHKKNPTKHLLLCDVIGQGHFSWVNKPIKSGVTRFTFTTPTGASIWEGITAVNQEFILLNSSFNYDSMLWSWTDAHWCFVSTLSAGTINIYTLRLNGWIRG